ncbi:MAG: MerR family DNA-binding protein [Betaproteobacteria bacterium]|nr:MerR family DNA-binding protein [Betaproteobacteria bacterium]
MPLGTTQKHLTIGELAQRAGVGVETIRFYERKGLITQPVRPAAGYRAYPQDVVARLGFVHEAKQLGFTLKEIRNLLTLRDSPQTDAAAVRGRAAAKLAQIEDGINRFQRMRVTLQDLLSRCPGSGELNKCSIVEALSVSAPQPAKRRSRGTRGFPMKTIDLTIQGMHCEGCAKTIEALLATEPGVKSATVSYGSGSARVLFDPASVDLPRLVKAVERAGYRVPESR